jgi:hypothetical protein
MPKVFVAYKSDLYFICLKMPTIEFVDASEGREIKIIKNNRPIPNDVILTTTVITGGTYSWTVELDRPILGSGIRVGIVPAYTRSWFFTKQNTWGPATCVGGDDSWYATSCNIPLLDEPRDILMYYDNPDFASTEKACSVELTVNHAVGYLVS